MRFDVFRFDLKIAIGILIGNRTLTDFARKKLQAKR